MGGSIVYGRKGGRGNGKGGRTCIMSLRTLGMSEKKKSAKIPATVPKDAAVTPLFGDEERELISLWILCSICALGKGIRDGEFGARDKGMTLVWDPNALEQGRSAGFDFQKKSHIQSQRLPRRDAMNIRLDLITTRSHLGQLVSLS